MNFTNEVVIPHELPQVENIAYHPLERKYLVTKRISLIISFAILLMILTSLFIFIEEIQSPIIIYSSVSAIIFLMIFSWIGTNISFSFSGYALRDKDILVRNGWLVRKIKILPLNRVQHVSVQSGPLERKFGLASVSVFTAGTGSADFTVRGITQTTAQQIKDWISIQINEHNPS